MQGIDCTEPSSFLKSNLGPLKVLSCFCFYNGRNSGKIYDSGINYILKKFIKVILYLACKRASVLVKCSVCG